MYSLPSTSKTRAPFARSTKNGFPPTPRKARTGEFTPPGIHFRASAKSSSDFARDNMAETLASTDAERKPLDEVLAESVFQAVENFFAPITNDLVEPNAVVHFHEKGAAHDVDGLRVLCDRGIEKL